MEETGRTADGKEDASDSKQVEETIDHDVMKILVGRDA